MVRKSNSVIVREPEKTLIRLKNQNLGIRNHPEGDRMSRISISGIKDPQRRKLIRVATHSMLEALVGKRLYLEIAIKFVPLMLQEGNMGSCELEDDDLVNPRLFNILIDDKLKGGEVLITLAHELVHVRQYAKGDLYQYQKTNHVRWRREKNVCTKSYLLRIPMGERSFLSSKRSRCGLHTILQRTRKTTCFPD
jgi:hypothetical protein